MAIQDPTINVTNSGFASVAAAQQNTQQQPQQTPSAAQSWSFHGKGMFNTPLAKGVGSEYYQKFKAGMVESFKAANESVEIALIDLDTNAVPAFAFSSIVVALRNKQMNSGVSYHILTLEATGDRIMPVLDTYMNQQYEIHRATSDAIDDVVIKAAQDKVRKAFPNAKVFFADGCVVPNGFNPEDKNATHKLAFNSGWACSTDLEVRADGFTDFNLRHTVHDSTLVITPVFNRIQVEDAVGAPMRSDVLIQFSSKKNNTNQGKYGSLNTGDKELRVSELSAFIDLVWSPVNNAGTFNPYMMQQNIATQKYVPRMVITNLANNFACTPGSVLMALATSLVLRDDNNWIQTFKPVLSSKSEIQLSDIGALNIEANYLNEPTGFGQRINTTADDFKLTELGMLVAALIQPGLIVSIDCPEYGPQSHYLSMFSQASNGNQGAIKLIFDAANQLTDGNFAKYFPQGSQMFVDQQNRIQLGTWIDKNGTKRDIRDIDHLAVCNLVGDRNPEMIRRWSDTFLMTSEPLPVRLAKRRALLDGMTNSTFNITGYAQRVTFSGVFMEALSRGIRDTGLPIRVNTNMTGNDFNNQRAVGNFAQAAMVAPGQSFMSQGNFSGYQNQFGNMGFVNQSRW
jgi:hypothetical protein